MPNNGHADIISASVQIGTFGRDINADAISDVLTFALTPFFKGIRSKRKCQKAVLKITQSIAGDAHWVELKERNGVLERDGILKDFFDEATTALMLNSIFYPRPTFRNEIMGLCYTRWFEACNPIEVNEMVEDVISEAFKCICKHFAQIEKLFTIKEVQAIINATQMKAAPYAAVDDKGATIGEVGDVGVSLEAVLGRAAPDGGSFLEYIKRLSRRRTDNAGNRSVNFSDAKTPFVGRDSELLELKKFCFSDKRLSWWSISGNSGAGKSCLASELCRMIAAERYYWYCVFVPGEFFESFNRFRGDWTLDRNLLVVVDNPGFYSVKLGEWLKQLIESDTVNQKVRLLIVDRMGLGGTAGGGGAAGAGDARVAGRAPGAAWWFHRLKDIVDINILRNLCYNTVLTSLELTAPDYTSCLFIYNELSKDNYKIKASRMRIMELWMKCDPLFAHPLLLKKIIAASVDDAIPIDCAGLAGFLEADYKSEAGKIAAKISDDAYEDPIYAATMLSIVLSYILASDAAIGDCVENICAIVGLGDDSETVNKVKMNFMAAAPDLFADNFAIQTLNNYNDIGYAKSIMIMAWRRGAYKTANFIRRAIDDYYIEYKLSDLINNLNVLYILPAEADIGAIALYGELMVYLSALQDAAGRTETLARLERLRSRGLQRERSTALKQAQILFNLSIGQDDAAEIAKTVARIAVLRSQGFERDKEITLRLYKALYNLILHQDSAERKETVSLMDELRNEGFEYDKDMALILAQSMFILTAKQDEGGIKSTVARMEELRGQGFEQDRDIALELIKALLNLTTKQDGAGRAETVARMEALRDQGFKHEREITLELVKAMLNLTIKQDEAGIKETVFRIENIRKQIFESDKELALILAQALLNLTTKQDEAGIAQTVERLEELRSQGFERDRDIALELSTALFNLTTRQDEVGIKKTVERLEALRNSGFVHDKEITLRLAQALFSLTTRPGPAVRKEAADRIDSLRDQGFENDRDITLTLVKSLYNLSIEQDSEGTKDTVMRIEEISSQGYAQDKEIKLLFAKSLFNLTTKLDVGGMAETVTRLETLRNRD